MNIVLHIERLVLDQAVLGDERASSVRTAVERELSQRLRQPGVIDALRGIGHAATLPAVPMPAPSSRLDRLAPRIATAVHNGLNPSGARSGHG
jgi:hypothetical protein